MTTIRDHLNRGESKWLIVLAAIAVCALIYLVLPKGSSEKPEPVAAERPLHSDNVPAVSPALINTNLSLGASERATDTGPAHVVPSREALRAEFDQRYEEMREMVYRDAIIIQ